MVARQMTAPWAGLGGRLEPDGTVDEWLKQARLDWTAEKAPTTYYSDGDERQWKGQNVLYRSDTNKPLAYVSDRYQTVQPKQVLSFFRDIADAHEGFNIETAGQLNGGARIWALAKSDTNAIEFSGDKVNRYLLMATSFDKSWPTYVKQTSFRPSCMNVLASPEGRISFTHIKAVDIQALRQKMDMDTAWDRFSDLLHKTVECRMTDAGSRKFLDTILFPKILREKDTFSQTAADRTLDNIISVMHHAPGQDTKAAKGTLWGTLNALSYYNTHGGSPRSNSGRFLRAFGNETINIQRRALNAAQILAA